MIKQKSTGDLLETLKKKSSYAEGQEEIKASSIPARCRRILTISWRKGHETRGHNAPLRAEKILLLLAV